MRVWLVFLWLLALAARAVAAPEPPPPQDFAGAQYIDGSGCVFARAGDNWAPRLDRQGAPVCGFPPTLSQRGLNLDAAPRPTVEDRLFEQFSQGLRDGEFTADPRQRQELHDPGLPDRQDPLTRNLQTAIARQEALRAAMSGARENSDLCNLLGYHSDPSDQPALGGDVTFGLCPGMRADPPRAILTEGARRDRVKVAAAEPVDDEAQTEAVTPAASPGIAAPAARPAARTSPDNGKRSAQAAHAARRPVPVVPGVEMIPANARYVQVGLYPDQASAEIIARRLIARGYPAGLARRDGYAPDVRAVLAGPFEDRGRLVRALNDLRRQGYDRAVAR